MNGYRPPRAGLDDGNRRKDPTKKTWESETVATITTRNMMSQSVTSTSPNASHLKPLPGESTSAFSARVNAALPILALQNRQSKNLVPGLKERETKLEKRMKRMRAQWWEEEKKIKEKREEGKEELRERIEKMGGGIFMDDVIAPQAKKRRGKKRAVGEGELEEEGDIWAQVGRKTQSTDDTAPASHLPKAPSKTAKDSGGLVGIHDVVSAPPKFSKNLKAKMKAAASKRSSETADGGLKRQVDLGQARKQVIEGYRAMMKEKGREAITV